MILKTLVNSVVLTIFFVTSALPVFAQAKDLRLPAPRTNIGKPLMQVLKDRKSAREFSNKEVPLQVLSDMLWAADGINRASGMRTAPTARNMQEIDVYVAKSDGLYLYNAKDNVLTQIIAADIRETTGKQDFVKSAPINLIFVADYSKMAGMSKDMMDFYSATDTGYVSQNVYLFCASEGLATVVRGMFDRPALEKAMKLRKDQKAILTQTVGYPRE